MLSPPGELLCTVHYARASESAASHDATSRYNCILRDMMCAAETLLCCCRQSITSSGSGHPCASAAGKLSLTTDQVSRGLLYRQHVLGVLDRYSPGACQVQNSSLASI